jgi:DegV family protein with EDD domain
MSQVAVITDSTASLPEELYGGYGIRKVPYYVHVGETSLRDTVDIQADGLASYMLGLAKTDQLPTTANPGPGDYVQAYQEAAEHARDIVSFHMTSVGSGAFQAARLGREMALASLDRVRIHVVDTRNVSMCHGWMSLQAARAAQAGAGVDEILALVKRMIPVTRMLQTADTLRYLYMGGRIGRAQDLVGSLLNIRPIVSMDDGVITTAGVARSRHASFTRITDLLERAVGPGGRVRVALTHAAAREDAETLLDMVRQAVTTVEELICDLSPALTVHSGPGTVGLCYVPESAIHPDA